MEQNHSTSPPPLSGAADRRRNIELIVMVILVVLALATHLPMAGDWMQLSPDGVTYLRAARSWARTGFLPAEHLTAPPGFVVLLIPFARDNDAPWAALRICFLLASACSAVLTFKLARSILSPLASFVAALLVVLSTVLLRLEATLLSETIFVTTSILTLVLMNSWRRDPSIHALFWTGIAAAATSSIRSIGLLLIPIGAWQIVRSGFSTRKKLAGLACFITPVIITSTLWQVRQSQFAPTKTYSADFLRARPVEHAQDSGFALYTDRFIRMAPLRFDQMKACILPPRIGWRLFQDPISNAASWIVGLGILCIAAYRSWRYRTAMDYYLLMTFAILCFWPWDEGDRFLAPLIPIFSIYLISMASALGQLLRRRIPLFLLTILALLMVIPFALEWASFYSNSLAREQKARTQFAAMQDVGKWLNTNIPKNAGLIGYVRQASNKKTTLLGGAYLANRRIIDMEDVIDGSTPQSAAVQNCFKILDDEVFKSAEKTRMHSSSCCGFTMLSPDNRP